MIDPFFPNKSPELMGNLLRIRGIAEGLPNRAKQELYSVLTSIHPDLCETKFSSESGFTLAFQNGQVLAFPSQLPAVILEHITCGYIEWLTRKYTLPGFVMVEPGDCVVDCGSFIGGFALGHVGVASEIHTFEPELSNYQCTVRNLQNFFNVCCENKG
ncbi:MAG: hypothetical protein AAF391_13020, partial [Bacteroidota bacterium]